MIDHPMHLQINHIGDDGQNMDSFTAGLVLDMDQSGLGNMMVAKATVLYWIKDLDAGKTIFKFLTAINCYGTTEIPEVLMCIY